MNNLQSLFSPKSVEQTQTSNAKNDEYRISFKEGKGGIYRSVVRFIPFYANPDKSIMQKFLTWIVDPITKKGMYVDDPRSVGQQSPVNSMYWALQNTNNAMLQQFGKEHLSSKLQYASLVQIIQDEQHPELVGQIKVFKFGKKIWDKLYAEEHPAMGAGTNPFHPIYGRYFSIVCTAQSGFNNFDQSNFFDNKNNQNQVISSGMWVKNPATDAFEVVTENTDQQMVYDYLASNSPDLANYDYIPWTADQSKFVNEVLALIANYVQTGTMQQNLQVAATPNNQPFFPGSIQGAPQPAQQPMAPAPTVPQMGGIPQMPQAPQPMAPQMPGIPNVNPMPQAPQMPSVGQVPQAPSPMGASSFSMGGTTISGIPGVQAEPATGIVGVDIPNVDSPNVMVGGNAAMSMQGVGNLDDIIAQL